MSSILLFYWQAAIDMVDDISSHLANNVRRLREGRSLSQQQIAKTAGVPRATWSNIESGDANPTLAVLTKVANALQVRLEELLGPPQTGAKYYPAHTLPNRVRQGASIRRLLPERLAGLEIERFELPPGGGYTGVPHTPGTREYLTCERGMLGLSVDGEQYELNAGDVVVFRGDQRHGYRNRGRTTTVGYSVVMFAPVGA
ncbi:MAG: XRE family transcriptional regulator [Myxococcota bacterium]